MTNPNCCQVARSMVSRAEYDLRQFVHKLGRYRTDPPARLVNKIPALKARLEEARQRYAEHQKEHNEP